MLKFASSIITFPPPHTLPSQRDMKVQQQLYYLFITADDCYHRFTVYKRIKFDNNV